MKDRVSLYPGRVKLTPVSGQSGFYDMERADQPTQEGTALNKNNLLKDATAALFGLDANAVLDDVFSLIPDLFGNQANHYVWSKQGLIDVVEVSSTETSVTLYGAVYSNAVLQYADAVEIVNGAISLVNPTTATITGTNVNTVIEKYVKTVQTESHSGKFFYCTAANGTIMVGKEVYVGNITDVIGYVSSPDPNAYPIDDGYTYALLGRLGGGARVATGSYTGTGTYGESNPTTLTFDFAPKVVLLDRVGTLVPPILSTNTSYRWWSNNLEISVSVTVMFNGNTVAMYNTSNAANQFNTSGKEYKYIAIG